VIVSLSGGSPETAGTQGREMTLNVPLTFRFNPGFDVSGTYNTYLRLAEKDGAELLSITIY